MARATLEQRVRAVRRFNRFYTRKIGVLNEGLLKSPLSLTEVRVLYELAHRAQLSASDLGRDLGLDAGYLSRILRGFEARGLIARRPSSADGRQHLLTLTKRGARTFAPLDRRACDEVRALLRDLSASGQERLVGAMRTVEHLLGGATSCTASVRLRTHRAGDIGWVVHRHGVLYAQEYGWDERFEALVADVAARFLKTFDPKCERCWIAERDGEPVGSVLLVKKSKRVAKLRLLLVEPSARGCGIARQLLDACQGFARAAGYSTITLWTNDVLHAARRLYQEAGFQLVRQEPHQLFGKGLIGQDWELKL